MEAEHARFDTLQQGLPLSEHERMLTMEQHLKEADTRVEEIEAQAAEARTCTLMEH